MSIIDTWPHNWGFYRENPEQAIQEMSNKIFQKHPDLGTRTFELVDDTIEYQISSQFGDEELTVVLSVLAPEPVVDGSMMYFVSEVNREALIKLFVDLPDADTFSKFVSKVQQRIIEEDFGKLDAGNRKSAVTREQVDTTINMLESYIDPTSIEILLSALRRLAKAPDNRECRDEVIKEFNSLGLQQGAVLTYAPFFSTFLPDAEQE